MSSDSKSPATGGSINFLSLPTEIKEAILSKVRNIRTLRAVSATCRSLRALLTHKPNHIIKRVLERYIPPQVMREALAVRASATLRTIDKESVEALLQAYFRIPSYHPRRFYSLRQASTLEQFYRTVRGFTSHFTVVTLLKNPVIGSPKEAEPRLTFRERCRIQQAFYRFELCCNLFREFTKVQNPRLPQPVIPLEDQARLFFNHFSVWENEQLGCIHDYLLRVIDKPFDDVAAHDIEWGEIEIAYGEGCKADHIRPWRKYYLSRGLRFIRHLGLTADYDKRCQILKAHMGLTFRFISDALHHSYHSRSRTPLEEYSAQQMKKELRPPAVNDPDKGPAEVWRVTHLECTKREFVLADRHLLLRQSGYVLWDHDRLNRWGLLEIPWNPSPSPSAEEMEEKYQKMRQSFARRTDIWRKGGRGWWSEDDESKVVYRKKSNVGPY